MNFFRSIMNFLLIFIGLIAIAALLVGTFYFFGAFLGLGLQLSKLTGLVEDYSGWMIMSIAEEPTSKLLIWGARGIVLLTFSVCYYFLYGWINKEGFFEKDYKERKKKDKELKTKMKSQEVERQIKQEIREQESIERSEYLKKTREIYDKSKKETKINEYINAFKNTVKRINTYFELARKDKRMINQLDELNKIEDMLGERKQHLKRLIYLLEKKDIKKLKEEFGKKKDLFDFNFITMFDKGLHMMTRQLEETDIGEIVYQTEMLEEFMAMMKKKEYKELFKYWINK